MVLLMDSKPAPPGSVVSANIRAEAVRRGRTGKQLAAAVGLSYRAWLNRMGGRVPWRQHEVADVARELGVTTSDLEAGRP